MISIDEMSILAHSLVDSQRETEKAELALYKAKEKERVLREETLPCAMQELGLSELKLSSGEKISIKQDVYVAIPTENRESCWAWLDKNGFGGMIKTELKLMFEKGEKAAAEALYERLREEGRSSSLKMDVHAQTLKAWMREQLREGRDVPLDLFGARPVCTAQVK